MEANNYENFENLYTNLKKMNNNKQTDNKNTKISLENNISKDNKITYIYRIYNHETGKNYIGKTNRNIHTRFQEHFKKLNGPLEKDLRKYGMSSFEFHILEELVNQDEKYIFEVEQSYIDEYDSLENGYNRRENFINEDEQLKMSRAIFNHDNKKKYINLSSVNDILGSYHLGQELINIYKEYRKELENEKKKINDITYLQAIRDHISIFLEEGIIDSVNKELLDIIVNDFTGNSKEIQEKHKLLSDIELLNVITYNFYETKEERRQRVKELYEKGYTRREISIITGIKNSIVSNDLQELYGKVNRNKVIYRKNGKLYIFGYEINMIFSVKKEKKDNEIK